MHTPSSRITLTVAMETVHFFFHSAIEFIFGKRKLFDLVPVQNNLGVCKVGQIGYWSMHSLALCMQILS